MTFSPALVMQFALAIATIFFASDLWVDYQEILAGDHSELGHYILETLIFILTLAALVYSQLEYRRAVRAIRVQEKKLSDLTGSFGKQITAQLQRWSLTKSEQEVAWLILKGYSFAEIAAFRDVTEKTARQQGSAVYAKAGATNRAEFSALFLEDIIAGSALK